RSVRLHREGVAANQAVNLRSAIRDLYRFVPMAGRLGNHHVVGLREGVWRLDAEREGSVRLDRHPFDALEHLLDRILHVLIDCGTAGTVHVLQLRRSPPRVDSCTSSAQRAEVLVDDLGVGVAFLMAEPLELTLAVGARAANEAI